jgi:uncharacterized membrane protein YvbJ
MPSAAIQVKETEKRMHASLTIGPTKQDKAVSSTRDTKAKAAGKGGVLNTPMKGL